MEPKEKKFDAKTDKSDDRRDPRKSRRGNRKGYRADTPEEAHKWTSGHNKLEWLLHNPELADIAGRVPSGTPVGARTGLIQSINASYHWKGDYRFPGILTMPSILTGGIASDANSPINVVGRAVWTFIRSKVSGTDVGDPNDLIATLLAEGQCVAFYGYLRRLQELISHTNPLNRYCREALVIANGADFRGLSESYAEFTYFVNYVGKRINNFIMPKLHYFDQAYEMFRRVFLDDQIRKGQYFMVVPYAFAYISYYRDETNGTQLKYARLDDDEIVSSTPIADASLGLQDLRDLADKLFLPLEDEEYVVKVNSAILKAYGDNLFKIDDFSTDIGNLEVKIDYEFILQIHNAELNFSQLMYYRTEGEESDIPTCVFDYYSVTPEAGDASIPYLKSRIQAASSGTLILSHYLDAFTDVPSTGEVLLASRWKVNTSGDPESTYISLKSTDVIVPVMFEVMHIENNGNFGSESLITQVVHGTWSATETVANLRTAIHNMKIQTRVSSFTGSPLMFIVKTLTSTDDAYGDNAPVVMGDVHNFTVLSSTLLEDIHRSNIYSLFEVPLKS